MNKSEMRGPVKHKDMMRLPHHPGWSDGRTGFQYCRFDAVVDQGRYIRAEITWLDDEKPGEGLDNVIYYNPVLRLETNRPVKEGKFVGWETIDSTEIELRGEQAKTLLDTDPAELLNSFAKEIAKLTQYDPLSDLELAIIKCDGDNLVSLSRKCVVASTDEYDTILIGKKTPVLDLHDDSPEGEHEDDNHETVAAKIAGLNPDEGFPGWDVIFDYLEKRPHLLHDKLPK